MKKSIILLMFAALAFASCQKSAVENLSGSYSFKTGGLLQLKTTVKSFEGGKLVDKDTVIVRSLVPESGQMRILPDSGDKAKVTMNITAGGPVVYDASVQDNSVSLSTVSRKLPVYREESLLDFIEEVLVSCSGTGTLYGNTIVFDIKCEGDFKLGDWPCTILSSDVKCVATRNE